MALPADYISGTITLTNGSPNFTGTGTGWQAADFREGDILLGVEDHAGQVYVIATITSQTSGTLTQEWAGTSGTYTYRMRYEWDSSRVSAQARAMVELLGNGNLEALAGLTGALNQVPVFTGPGAMTLVPRADFGSGDVVGPASAVNSALAAFDGTSGKLIKVAAGVTNAQLANVPTATLKGRSAAGAGTPTDLTATQVWSLLGVAPVANIPATLTPDKAFRRGNILGTVSQSGGVPTGAIIEGGSNANGTYAKFADGTLMCWVDNKQAVYLNQYEIKGSWTFPAAFATTNISGHATVRDNAGALSDGARGKGPVFFQVMASNYADFGTMGNAGSFSAGQTMNARLFAIGRWF